MSTLSVARSLAFAAFLLFLVAMLIHYGVIAFGGAQ